MWQHRLPEGNISPRSTPYFSWQQAPQRYSPCVYTLWLFFYRDTCNYSETRTLGLTLGGAWNVPNIPMCANDSLFLHVCVETHFVFIFISVSVFLFFFCLQSGSTAGTDEKKSPPTTTAASTSGDEGAGDSSATAALSAEGSEGGGSVDGSSSRGGGKEASTSGGAAEASSSSSAAAAAAGTGEASSASTQSAGATSTEDGAAAAPGASRWGGKKSFLDVSRGGRCFVCLTWTIIDGPYFTVVSPIDSLY